MAKSGDFTRERARFWGVSLRVMQRMLAEVPPWPVDDEAAMIRRVMDLPSDSRRKLSDGLRRRVDQLRLEHERRGTPGAALADPYYAEFIATHQASATAETDDLARLKNQRAYLTFKIERATIASDIDAVKDATELLKHIASIIYDREMMDARLGREAVEMVPVHEVQRLARAVAYWQLRCVDEIHLAVCKPLSDASASGPLFPEEIRRLLEPVLLSRRVFEPMVRALQTPAAAALPAWFVQAHRAALDTVIEDAPRLFAELYPTPPPPPAPVFTAGDGI